MNVIVIANKGSHYCPTDLRIGDEQWNNFPFPKFYDYRRSISIRLSMQFSQVYVIGVGKTQRIDEAYSTLPPVGYIQLLAVLLSTMCSCSSDKSNDWNQNNE